MLSVHLLPQVTSLRWVTGRTTSLLHDPHVATIHLFLHKLQWTKGTLYIVSRTHKVEMRTSMTDDHRGDLKE